jgi:serine phosphatase RsbU (regulator of sigma subunit)/AmiR/NasT family two-component response regulator
MNRRKNAQRKLLIVEGDTLIASKLKQNLEVLGFKKLSFCHNVNDCLRILRTDLPPDLIIIDISLKGKPNAIDLAEQLTNDIRIPFVFSTTADEQGLYEQASNTIPYGIVIKPYNPALLEFTLETCFDLIELRHLLTIKNEDLVYANKLINLQKDDLLKSFESARDLQSAILPEATGINDFFGKSFMINRPKSLIGGDFFWQYKLNDNELLFGVMDCTGHAVSGALMSILIHTYLLSVVKDFGVSEPADIFWLLDKRLLNQTIDAEPDREELGAGMDAILCHYNKKEQLLRFSGARRPLLHLSKNKLEIHKGYRAPVGLYSMEQKEFDKNQIKLKTGDRLFLFTDGYSDQIGEFSDSKYKTGPFYQFLEENGNIALDELEKLLIETHINWKGRLDQTDDIMFCALELQ